MIRTIAAVLMTTALGSAQAATNFYEGFEDVAALGTKGWSNLNLSRAPMGEGWFQGSGAEMTAADGTATSYAAVNYLTTGVGAIDDWLITPAIELTGDDVLHFAIQGVPGPWIDNLRVLVGDGSATTRTDFTTVSFDISGIPQQWTDISLDLPSSTANGSVRIAFEYYGTFRTSNFMGLDAISVTGNAAAVPEPTSALLLALGLGATIMRSRRRPSRTAAL
jgi:hypothetical protein